MYIPNYTKDDADNPGKCATFKVSSSDNVSMAVGAIGSNWNSIECLYNHNRSLRLGDNDSVHMRLG